MLSSRQTILRLHAGKWHFDSASRDRKKTLQCRSRLRSLIQTQTTLEDDGFQVHWKLFRKDNSAHALQASATTILKAVLALSDDWQKKL